MMLHGRVLICLIAGVAADQGCSADANGKSTCQSTDQTALLQGRVLVHKDDAQDVENQDNEKKTEDGHSPHFHTTAAPQHRTTSAPSSQQYYKMDQGSCCCPANARISSSSECEGAHDALGLSRTAPWSGNTNAIPGQCSWGSNPFANFHWNAASTGALHLVPVDGSARSDMSPICRRMTGGSMLGGSMSPPSGSMMGGSSPPSGSMMGGSMMGGNPS
jgi:hypothetical protein